MAAHRPGVGMGGQKGLLGHLQQIIEARVVEVRHVHQDAASLQLWDHRFSEGGQPVVRGVARADLILAVPHQRHRPHPLVCQHLDAAQVSGQRRSVLDGEKGRCLISGPCPLHVRIGAAGGCPLRKLLHLAKKVLPVLLKIVDGRLSPILIGNKDRIKLSPVHILRHGGQGQHPLRVVQRVRIPRRGGPAVCQRVTVQIDQRFGIHKATPFCPEGNSPPVLDHGRRAGRTSVRPALSALFKLGQASSSIRP